MKYAAYYRVSTQKQGVSGLGLEAQQSAVESYLQNKKESGTVEHFTEIESGSNKERPQLKLALDYCREHGAKLIIAKLDRLSRSMHFISGLMDSKVDFVACDMPDANKLTIHIMAAVAEAERDAISTRTAAAYREYKKRGGSKWGRVRAGTMKRRSEKKLNYLKNLSEIIRKLGSCSIDGQIEELNLMGIMSPRGRPFNRDSLYRVKRELQENEEKIFHRQ